MSLLLKVVLSFEEPSEGQSRVSGGESGGSVKGGRHGPDGIQFGWFGGRVCIVFSVMSSHDLVYVRL